MATKNDVLTDDDEGDQHKLSDERTLNVSEDLTEASLQLPGFAWRDCNRLGVPDPWKVLSLVEEAYDYACAFGLERCGRDFFDAKIVAGEKLAFTVLFKLEIMEEFYQNLNDLMFQPVEVKSYLNKVGKSSLQMLKCLYNVKGQLLATVQHTFVYVDPETHRPSPHPQEYVDRFGKVKSRVTFKSFRPQEKDKKAFSTEYRVKWSDTDSYYHSNQASYPRYAMNAATEACFAGHFNHFTKGDLAYYPVRSMTMLYSGETMPGDNLNCYVWEDKDIPRRIHCQLEKHDKSVYTTVIDFHKPKRFLRNVNTSKL